MGGKGIVMQKKRKSFYEKYLKRMLDFVVSFIALILVSPILLIVSVMVRIKLGSPVIFSQKRPGKDEKIFTMYKFRSMTDQRDAEGNLLPDEIRLTNFGKKLRSTSLDELPELFNILKGDMSIIGPRPQLVRDMVFMSPEQRRRHSVLPGLSGLAQIRGRNAISWEDKLSSDLEYIEHISLVGDITIVLITIVKAFIKQEGITDKDMATAEDYGDYLLRTGQITKEQYNQKQKEATQYLNDNVS